MNQSKEEKNKALVLDAFDTLFNRRDYAAAERYWSPNYIQHSAHIAPPAKDLIALPGGADPQQLAMIRINPPTAYLLLDQFVQLQSGDYDAINAANSSIARWIVGFAKQKRVRVVG